MAELDRSVLLQTVRDVLARLAKQQRHLRYRDFWNESVRAVKLKGGIVENDRLLRAANALCQEQSPDHDFAIQFSALFQELLSRGYIAPSPNELAPDLSNFVLTSVGCEWLEQAEPIPEDAKGYLSTVDLLVPNLDIVVKQYIQEALLTYNQPAAFACAVMIGAASERLTYLLLEAVQSSTRDTQEKARIDRLLNIERSLPKMFSLIESAIVRAKAAGMPYQVYEGTDHYLLSVQEAIRVERNDAVHPQVAQVTVVAVRLSLAAFPTVAKKIYDLITWFQQNPIS